VLVFQCENAFHSEFFEALVFSRNYSSFEVGPLSGRCNESPVGSVRCIISASDINIFYVLYKIEVL